MKKCCCIVVIAMITGAVFYFLCGLKGEAIQENGYLGQKLRSKREKVKQACECMKAQGEDIAREVKFAAEYSADEIRTAGNMRVKQCVMLPVRLKQICLR